MELDNKNRDIMVLLVVSAALLAYRAVALFTELNWNPRDPSYYQKNYQTSYELLINGKSIDTIEFSSTVINSTHSNASIKIGNNIQLIYINPMGLWYNQSTLTNYSLVYWFFIENPIQETLGNFLTEMAHSKPSIQLVDPFGIFGAPMATFTLKFIKFYIETFEKFSTQVSNLYEVYSQSGVKIGEALYDTTCGLCWWFDVYNVATENGVKINMTETNFVISRNRYWYTGTMLTFFAIWGLFFALLSKKLKIKTEDRNVMIKMIILGDLAFFIDGILYIWYTKYLPWLFVIHILYLILCLLLFPKLWRVGFIVGLELGMYVIMIFFQGKSDLVLTFGPCQIAAWIGLSICLNLRYNVRKEFEKKK